MKEAKMHEHPAKTVPDGRGFTHVYGSQLEVGDTIESTDVYSSSSGYWEVCPCPGQVLGEGVAVVWVRPH